MNGVQGASEAASMWTTTHERIRNCGLGYRYRTLLAEACRGRPLALVIFRIGKSGNRHGLGRIYGVQKERSEAKETKVARDEGK